MSVQNLSNSSQNDVAITFGQVFAPGALPVGTPVMVRDAAGAQAILPTQMDVKASHNDGSIRHAVISARIPSMAANENRAIELVVVNAAPQGTDVDLNGLLLAGFDANVTLSLGGATYTASAADQLAGASTQAWLSGPQVSEWISNEPVKDSNGNEHGHLTARFNVRAYSGYDVVRVDVIIENNWAYEPGPRNYNYDVNVSVCGTQLYTQTNLTHYNHARWRKTFWCGTDPQTHIAHNTGDLIDTGAIPNYDRTITIPESALASMGSSWTGPSIEPMGIGSQEAYMPQTGGRADIGPLPRWTVRHLLSQDRRAKMVDLGNADLAGSWSIHYRDRNTGLPVSIDDYPYMSTLDGYNSTYNPAQNRYEAFPSCGGNCSTPYTDDTSHQPALAYLPYIVTGDHYYLEEVLFWANYNMVQANPGSRNYSSGWVRWDQVRGQAWSLRSLGHAAYITPDNHPLKNYFIAKVNNNIDYYDSNYTNNVSAPALGYIINGYAIKNDGGGPGQIAVWEDDSVTIVVDRLTNMGFLNAIPFRDWKAKFVNGRFANHPTVCKQNAAPYRFVVQYTFGTGPIIDSWADAFAATFPSNVGNCPSTWSGAPQDPESYLSVTRGALAAAHAAGYVSATAYFDEIVAVQDAINTRFDLTPQWAILPRNN